MPVVKLKETVFVLTTTQSPLTTDPILQTDGIQSIMHLESSSSAANKPVSDLFAQPSECANTSDVWFQWQIYDGKFRLRVYEVPDICDQRSCPPSFIMMCGHLVIGQLVKNKWKTGRQNFWLGLG